MTITNNTIRTSTNGDGTTVGFAVSFPFYDESELVVILIDVDGNEVTQTLTTDYTVSGGNGATGTITMVIPPASGERLVRYRSSPLTQETDYADGDAFPADSHEAALDRLTMQNQEQADKLARALTLSESSEVAGSLSMEEPAAGRGLKWNATEDGIINTSVNLDTLEAEIAANSAQTALDRIATAADVVLTNADVVSTNADVVSSAANALVAVSGVGGVKVSINDTTPSVLENKILGSGLAGMSVQNNGGNETLTVDVPVASQAEAEAGVATDKVMTAERTGQAITALSPLAGSKIYLLRQGY